MFTMHIKVHQKKEKKLECFKCSFEAESKGELKTHMKDIHPSLVSVYSCEWDRWSVESEACQR